MHKLRSEHLTRCPHCDSVYEVSEEELELAYGAVRCGECMKIFNARFHRVDPQDAPDADEDEVITTDHQDPIPTLRDHLFHPAREAETAEELNLNRLAFAEDEEPELPADEEKLDAELLAFEAELETALYDPDTASEPEDNHETPDQQLTTAEDTLETQEALQADEALVTESRPSATKSHKKSKAKTPVNPAALLASSRNYLIALAIVLVASLASLGAWLVLTPEASSKFAAEEVRISPSTSPQKMTIHFQLVNLSNDSQSLPDLQVDLLNLSRQVIASQQVSAQAIEADNRQLAAGERLAAKVEVDRPSTYVQNARIHPLTP